MVVLKDSPWVAQLVLLKAVLKVVQLDHDSAVPLALPLVDLLAVLKAVLMVPQMVVLTVDKMGDQLVDDLVVQWVHHLVIE